MSDSKTVRWYYVGRRLTSDDKLVYAWVPEFDVEREPLIFSKIKGSAIGNIYTVEIDADSEKDGNYRAYQNSEKWTKERLADDTMIAMWQALDQNARDTADKQKAERALSKSDELDRALEDVIRIFKKARTFGQQEAILSAINSKIRRAR